MLRCGGCTLRSARSACLMWRCGGGKDEFVHAHRNTVFCCLLLIDDGLAACSGIWERPHDPCQAGVRTSHCGPNRIGGAGSRPPSSAPSHDTSRCLYIPLVPAWNSFQNSAPP